MLTKKEFLTQLFETLSTNNISYFVYGKYETLPNDTGGSDVDIMVDSNDFESLCNIVLYLVEKGNIVSASYYAQPHCAMFRLITKSWGVQLDLLKGYYYRGETFFPKSRLVNEIIIYNNIRVLSPEMRYYTAFFKVIVNNGRIEEKYIVDFCNVVNNNPEKYYNDICEIYSESIAKFIFANLSISNLSEIAPSLQKKIHSHIFRKKILKKQLYRFQLLGRIFSPPGYVIAVLGTDGSGKSTIINAITPILNEAFHNTVIYNHLRPHYLPDLGVTLKQREESDAAIVNCDPHSQKSSGMIGSLVRWGYYLVDYSLGYLLKIFPSTRVRSKVFIFDRYYYDYYIDQKRSRINLPKWIIKMGECIVPTPDLILCLGGDPQIIYTRKPETSLEEVCKQTSALKAFCDNEKRAVWVDTSVEIETSVDCAMDAICKCMDVRFKKIKK